jgi:hypothetical protein
MTRVAFVGFGLVFALILAACAEDARGDNLDNPTAGRTGSLPDDGSASCVESYAPQAVAARSFAFDGEVVKVGPSVSDRGDGGDLNLPGVTFNVHEWFAGGQADTVTLDMQSPRSGAGPSEDGGDASYGVGSRLLVSGEARWGGSPLSQPIAWVCGFTRYYDPRTATEWRDAS